MNEKIKINNNVFVCPMPMVIVGAVVDGKENFMAAGWVSRVNANPPMIAIALGKHHHTNKGIREHQTFSINVPSTALLAQTDYCGLVSGEKVDKAKLFESFSGELKNAPMIKQCPLTLECKVSQTIELPTNELFIAEIVGAYTEDQYLSAGKLDITKIKPFTLTMPDNGYWAIGERLGQAWSMGKNLNAK